LLILAKSEEELKFLYDTRTHPEIDKMLSGEPPKSYEQHLNYLNKVLGKTRWVYIAYNEENNKIGYSQIYDVTETHLEVGFAIHPNFQGKGYGKSIVEETIKKAIETFPDKKIILYVKKDNPKAIHIYEKFGFEKKGTKADTFYMEIKCVS